MYVVCHNMYWYSKDSLRVRASILWPRPVVYLEIFGEFKAISHGTRWITGLLWSRSLVWSMLPMLHIARKSSLPRSKLNIAMVGGEMCGLSQSIQSPNYVFSFWRVLKAETDRDGQRRTETDRDGQRRTETDRDGQRRTETDRDGQRRWFVICNDDFCDWRPGLLYATCCMVFIVWGQNLSHKLSLHLPLLSSLCYAIRRRFSLRSILRKKSNAINRLYIYNYIYIDHIYIYIYI